MLRRLAPMLFVICLMLLTSGCAVNRATSTVTPGADLSKVKSFYIVEKQGDKGTYNVYKLIESNLAKRGYAVTTGSDMKSPYKLDVILTYVDKWKWDMSMYMLQLTITFKDATNNLTMASGNSIHTSLTRKPPEEMVEEVLTNIFNAKATGKEETYVPPVQETPPVQPKSVFIPSETKESKACRMECKKIQLMELQLLQQSFNTTRYPAIMESLSGPKKSEIERNYNKCIVDCGGTHETR